MKHGLSKTRLYNIYSGMKQYCYNLMEYISDEK